MCRAGDNVKGPGPEEPDHRIRAESGAVYSCKPGMLTRPDLEFHRLPDERVVDPKPVRSRFDILRHGLSKSRVPAFFPSIETTSCRIRTSCSDVRATVMRPGSMDTRVSYRECAR